MWLGPLGRVSTELRRFMMFRQVGRNYYPFPVLLRSKNIGCFAFSHFQWICQTDYFPLSLPLPLHPSFTTSPLLSPCPLYLPLTFAQSSRPSNLYPSPQAHLCHPHQARLHHRRFLRPRRLVLLRRGGGTKLWLQLLHQTGGGENGGRKAENSLSRQGRRRSG